MNNKYGTALYLAVFALVAVVLSTAMMMNRVSNLEKQLAIALGATGETLGNTNEFNLVQLDINRSIDERLDRLDTEIFTMPDGRWFGDTLDIDSRLDILDYDTEGPHGNSKSINNLYGWVMNLEGDICQAYDLLPELAESEVWSNCYPWMLDERREDNDGGAGAYLTPITETENVLEFLVNLEALTNRLDGLQQDQRKLYNLTWDLWDEVYRFPADAEYDNGLDMTSFYSGDWRDSQSRLDYAIDQVEWNKELWYYNEDRTSMIIWDYICEQEDKIYPLCAR